MKYSEKLRRLTDDRQKRKLSVKCGLPATAISNAIAKGNTPRSDNALAIARALSVDVEWLIDDAQEWPPKFKNYPEPATQQSVAA